TRIATRSSHLSIVSLHAYAAHRDLHSFPTRRSSDLQFTEFLREWTKSGTLQTSVANKLNEWIEEGLQPWDISREAPYFGFEIPEDRKSTRLNSSHVSISYAVFCLKKKNSST